MTIDDISRLVMTSARCKAVRVLSSKGGMATGLSGSSAAMMLAAIPSKVPVVVVGDGLDDAGYLYFDLCRIVGESGVAMLPSGFKRDIKYGQIDPPNQILRTETLSRLSAGDIRFVVTYPDALAESVASRDDLSEHTLTLTKDTRADMNQVRAWLVDKGFREVDYVFEPGQFAIRGSIFDIFGYSAELPFRLDFFGDEIDSIRAFNIETQLSEVKFDSVNIIANVSHDNRGMSLLDFIDAGTVVAFRDERQALARIREIGESKISAYTLLTEDGDPDAMDVVIDAAAFESKLAAFVRVGFSAARPGDDGTPVNPYVRTRLDFDCTPQGVYHKNFDLIAEFFTRFIGEGYRLFILSDNQRQFDRLRDIFADRGDKIDFEAVDGTIHEGFVDHEQKLCVFTDHQIFDRFHKYTLKSDRVRSGKLAMSLKELSALEPGDYIVHVDHGVGKFAGLLRTSINGKMQEVIKLVYKDGDTLLVSIHSLHKLAKYRGKEGVPPKINRIGSGSWQRMKEKTKSKLKDIARDLIRLYAARRDEKGFAFNPDTYLQHELEASFIYEDTPDQLTATQAVKHDMESNTPMDRLICGDVGFGKTEIAVRAAFKAATDGKQVAVLVPTTVLAYQHYNTFSERLKEFPVRVEYFSRARSAKDIKAITEDLAAGKIDIIIGTHKLIGKSVKFKDLGLLIVDEEQKFGVAVKERLRQMRVNVDTLTMSATPIPRTLQFSLMGARDLSTINTPPPNRYPIITSVDVLNDDTVAEAINFELARGGQVFFVNPRIEGLFDLENMVKRLVPDARTIVAHGQMKPESLEQAINDFSAHDYDILLATTIIESGIDMPNVNTIIINDAHKFGLSELHQLRGRVGRSSRKAFCYLFVPPGDAMTPVARRRLQAIESFSELGSGIHIAMQDLDIRGAGNLLGAEQSGFIADLGYEAYQQILRESVTELKTEEFGDEFQDVSDAATGQEEYVNEVTIESDLELRLPPEYVPQENERITLYRQLDNMERPEQVEEFRAELRDRFGAIPDVSEELIKVVPLRFEAKKAGIERLVLKNGQMRAYFVGAENKAYYQSRAFGRVLEWLQGNPRDTQFRKAGERNLIVIGNVTTVSRALDIMTAINAQQ